MTGRTGIMLDVIARIGEGRIGYRGAMAILTGNRQGHIAGACMIYVMGKQVKRRTVINVAVTLRTVAGDPAVLQRTVSVMTYRTGVMLDVIAGIYKGLARGYCRCMTAVAVRCQRHVTGAGMIDTMIIPGPAGMTGRTDRTAAGTCRGVGYERQILITGMTGRTGIMLDVVSCIGKERIVNCCGMTVKTGCLGVHIIARIMINIMGEEI